ncbi:MAG: exopolysaccharide biosynthesis polyprenyl glycosylphosphotransferase [Sphingomonas sp.]
MTPLYITMGLNARAYSTAGIQDPGLGVKRAVQAFVIAAGAFLLVAFYLKTSDTFSRVILALGSGTSIVLLAGVRAVFLRKARGIVGGNPYNVVLITDGGQHIAHDGFSLVVPANAHLDPSLDCPMMFDRLAITLRDADRVIVTCEASRRLDWVKALKGANVRAEILAPELDSLAPLGLGSWGAAPTIVVADGPLGKLDLLVKRAFDVATALVALVVLAPVLIVTAILIKLESKGPVFFVQTRIGQGNRMFRMLKFRSMRVESSDGAGVTSTRRDDDRITRVGAAIRKTSIDELPQLLNVLIGDMSIVGPRPHALGSRAEDKLFWEIDKRYWHRHAAKPGLTGLAQVRGYRGATAVESDLTDRLQADLEYLRDWSIWKDFKIVLLTFGVLVHRNAY